MTCVSCSQTIERAMKNEFLSKGLQEVLIAVLTHKMRVVFDQQIFQKSGLSPSKIIEEVEMVGFTAELLETIIDNPTMLRRADSYQQDNENTLVQTTFDQQRSVIKNCVLSVTGMTCAACQSTIENHLSSHDGIISATVSLLTHKAQIQYEEKKIGIRDIIGEIEALGFEASYQAQNDKSDIRDIVNESVIKYRNKFLISMLLQIPILIMVWILPYSNPSFIVAINQANGVPLYVYLIAGFSTVIQIAIGASFYVSAYKSVRHKSANMDVLIVLGTTAAWGYGIALVGVGYKHHEMEDEAMYKMQVQEHAHNFEISSVLITIILLGKLLESISKKKTVDKLSQLASLKVTKANLIEQKEFKHLDLNSSDKEVPVELLQVNDFVKVYPGAGIPVDGVIIFGKGISNEAMLTGESRPVHKDIGSQVYGGSTLIQGNLIIKVKKTAENSSINQIIKLVENAQNSKAPIQGLADKIANYFVPCVIILALITWVIWFAYAYSDKGKQSIELRGQTRFQFAFSFGIATLVIACPCALGLATPTAVMVGTGVAANYGILIKGGDVLEKIHHITTIVFDKTGTLTSGMPLVKDLISVKEHFRLQEGIDNKDVLLYFTYLIEKQSEHPLAKAVVKKIHGLIPSKIEEFNAQYSLKDFKNRDGEGVIGNILNIQTDTLHEVICGNDKLIAAFNIAHQEDELKKNIELLEQEGNTVVQLAVDGIPQLIITLEETHLAKQESKEVVNYLKNTLKLKVKMITGDNQHAAFKVARHVGIDQDDVTYKAYPEDKKRVVEKLQDEGEKVMFVGDGINDSPVLAQANVGVAINSGSEITVNAASIVLMKDNLFDVVNAIRISKKSFRRIKINFAWAFLYNMLLVPIAMGILFPINQIKLDPMYAGAAMALSSISVVLSSLMLRMFTPYDLSNKKYHEKRQKQVHSKLSNHSQSPEASTAQTTETNEII